MLRNITRNIVPLNKSILFKRYNVPQAIFNVRYKQNTTNQHMTTDIDDDEEESPIIYSKSEAANMRVNEYRLPYKKDIPDYQPLIIVLSLTVFLIYFCILREDNDIDELIYTDLNTNLKQMEIKYKKNTDNHRSK